MLKQYLTTQFLFQINRVSLETADKALFLFGWVLVLLGLVFLVGARLAPTSVDKKYRQKLFKLFFSAGLMEIIWFGLRFQNVKFFGTHFVALLILLIAFIWLIEVVLQLIKNYSKEKRAWEKERVRLKYLPK